MSPQIGRIVVGQLGTNCYFLIGSEYYLILDPGDEAQKILEHAETLTRKPLAVICTHGHFDHVIAAEDVSRRLGIPFCVHRKDAERLAEMWEYSRSAGVVTDPPKPDIVLQGNETWDLGGEIVSMMHTPGHTEGSICLLVGDIIFSGDTLFKDSIGRTDFGGNNNKMIESLLSLSKLDPELVVYPGHGEKTRIRDEIENMRFFIDLLKQS